MRVEEIDALLGGEAQRLADQYTSVPLDFMDGYGWALTQICRLFPDAVPVIRCKDCRYHDIKTFRELVLHRCYVNPDDVETSPDGYCYLAERKEE